LNDDGVIAVDFIFDGVIDTMTEKARVYDGERALHFSFSKAT
jgi:hypothetical protein